MVSHTIIKDLPACAKASADKGHPGATGWPVFCPSSILRRPYPKRKLFPLLRICEVVKPPNTVLTAGRVRGCSQNENIFSSPADCAIFADKHKKIHNPRTCNNRCISGRFNISGNFQPQILPIETATIINFRVISFPQPITHDVDFTFSIPFS
jgi:hypothetical protein